MNFVRELFSSGGTMVLIFFAMVFGVGAIAIISEHFQKMAKIRADAEKRGSREVMSAIEKLRQEIADLRDTTTRYDVSFDSALQRLESRVETLESRSRTAGAAVSAPASRPEL